MKLNHKILTFIIIAVLGVGIWFVSISYLQSRASANGDLYADHDPKVLKEKANIIIEQVSQDYTINGEKFTPITKEQAIEIAKASTGLESVKHIHAQYCLITDECIRAGVLKYAAEKNPYFKDAQYVNKVPVWIISFRGMDMPRRNGVKRTELNTVVDAKSGTILYDFVYR